MDKQIYPLTKGKLALILVLLVASLTVAFIWHNFIAVIIGIVAWMVYFSSLWDFKPPFVKLRRE